jgi:ABC-type transport system involved in Fe-S cluster assembly fused permease/ATPase subunit
MLLDLHQGVGSQVGRRLNNHITSPITSPHGSGCWESVRRRKIYMIGARMLDFYLSAQMLRVMHHWCVCVCVCVCVSVCVCVYIHVHT